MGQREPCLGARGAVRVGPGHAHELQAFALDPGLELGGLFALLLRPETVLFDEPQLGLLLRYHAGTLFHDRHGTPFTWGLHLVAPSIPRQDGLALPGP